MRNIVQKQHAVFPDYRQKWNYNKVTEIEHEKFLFIRPLDFREESTIVFCGLIYF